MCKPLDATIVHCTMLVEKSEPDEFLESCEGGIRRLMKKTRKCVSEAHGVTPLRWMFSARKQDSVSRLGTHVHAVSPFEIHRTFEGLRDPSKTPPYESTSVRPLG
jgi:hypothetical protein